MTPTSRRTILGLAGTSLLHAVEGWTPMTQWKSNAPGSWKFENGEILAGGPVSHLFYDGPGAGDIRDFELEFEVMTRPGANSGVYFHTAFQDGGFPKQGFEVQVNNTATGEGAYRERKRTGSLYGIRNVYRQVANDDEWIRMHVAVAANNVQVRVNGLLTVDYIEPDPPVLPPSQETARFLQKGTFALQCHDPGSKVRYRNLRFRRLADGHPPRPAPAADDLFRKILSLGVKNYPMVDLHVHFHGTLGLAEAMEQSRRDGITYGIAANCGRQSRVRTDAGAVAFADLVRGQTAFIGMQAEGEDWTRHFTLDTCRKFDYIFNDGMIWTGDQGQWTRLYRPEDLGPVPDPDRFMEEYVARLVRMISTQPIDFYANTTYLPEAIRSRYEELWTAARMDRVIAAAARHQVAIELNDRYRIPSEAFVRVLSASLRDCGIAL